MTAALMARQAALVAERCKLSDIVVSTALIPGRPAPELISAETVQGMKPGSVIVDLAVERGGNCPLSEKDKVVERHGVTLIGYSNLPALVPTDASALYARNVLEDRKSTRLNYQSLMRISYAVFCLKTKNKIHQSHNTNYILNY